MKDEKSYCTNGELCFLKSMHDSFNFNKKHVSIIQHKNIETVYHGLLVH